MGKGMQVFSIFGQIDRVAAEMMIDANKGKKIEFEHIPDTARYNSNGDKAVFAVMFTDNRYVQEFEQKIADLRA